MGVLVEPYFMVGLSYIDLLEEARKKGKKEIEELDNKFLTVSQDLGLRMNPLIFSLGNAGPGGRRMWR